MSFPLYHTWSPDLRRTQVKTSNWVRFLKPPCLLPPNLLRNKSFASGASLPVSFSLCHCLLVRTSRLPRSNTNGRIFSRSPGNVKKLKRKKKKECTHPDAVKDEYVSDLGTLPLLLAPERLFTNCTFDSHTIHLLTALCQTRHSLNAFDQFWKQKSFPFPPNFNLTHLC